MNASLTCSPLIHAHEPLIGGRNRCGYAEASTFKKGEETSFPSRSKVSNQNGFTLVEIIVSITVIAIIGVIAGVGLVEIAKGYVFSKKNSVAAQQGQIAMARLKKEISNIKTIISATDTSIRFTRNSDGTSHSISWTGTSGLLLIDTDRLLSPVSSFKLSYFEFNPASSDPFKFIETSSYSSKTSIIEITLQLMAAEDTPITLIDRVNLYQETGG